MDTTEQKVPDLTLQRIMLFVSDMEKQTMYYRDILGLTVLQDREGFVEFDTGGCTIALHRGAGRRPRYDFTTREDIAVVRGELNKRGAKLGELKQRGEQLFCQGKDREGNSIQISGYLDAAGVEQREIPLS